MLPPSTSTANSTRKAPPRCAPCRPRRPASALKLVVLGWFLLAGACAPGGTVYDKPGVTYEEWRRDDTECRQTASTAGSSAAQTEAYPRCMRARGYHLRER